MKLSGDERSKNELNFLVLCTLYISALSCFFMTIFLGYLKMKGTLFDLI